MKTYSYEQTETAALDREEEAQFRRNRKAWKFFAAQPPGYRHLVIWRIISAKRHSFPASYLKNLAEWSYQRAIATLSKAQQNAICMFDP